MNSPPIRIFSWNINGVRAAVRKGFLDWLHAERPDVLGLQEVRASIEQIPSGLREHPDYRSHYVSAERKGYSGVGILARELASIPLHLGSLSLDQSEQVSDHRFDTEGRLQFATLGKLKIVNGYFPNGDGKNRDNSRVPYKLAFYEALRRYLRIELQAGVPLLVIGDWNTAHRPIDLARPATNKNTSGFLPEERAAFDAWLSDGWVDTFRHFHPVKDPFALPKKGGKELPAGGGHFTWWSQRVGVREKNVGWRIDYILASPGAMPFLRSASIHPQVFGSDHCPVSVELSRDVLGS